MKVLVILLSVGGLLISGAIGAVATAEPNRAIYDLSLEQYDQVIQESKIDLLLEKYNQAIEASKKEFSLRLAKEINPLSEKFYQAKR